MTFEAWREVRDNALRALDTEYLLDVQPNLRGRPREFLLTILHKGRYECLSIEPQLRQESGVWLSERGLEGMSGPILPKGELPK